MIDAEPDNTMSLDELREAHSLLVMQKAHAAMKTAVLPPPKNWRDVKIVDDMMRRSSGLDDVEQSPMINIGLLSGPDTEVVVEEQSDVNEDTA